MMEVSRLFLPVRSDHPKPDFDSGGDGKDGTAAVSPSDNSGQSYLEYGAHRSRRGGGGIVGTYSGAVKNIFPLRRDGSGNLGICGGECVFSETITTRGENVQKFPKIVVYKE